MSKQPRFTPAPWKAERSEAHGIFWVQAPDEGVCDLYVRVASETFSPFRNAEANVHLIAAAPELYEALEVIRDADNDCIADGHPRRVSDMVRSKIDAAMAKAEGRS